MRKTGGNRKNELDVFNLFCYDFFWDLCYYKNLFWRRTINMKHSTIQDTWREKLNEDNQNGKR